MQSRSLAKKILVVRNDKLGDFMLSYPTFAMLKQNLPDAEIHALVKPYTQAMAELCPAIDTVQLDMDQAAGIPGFFKLVRQLREQDYDAVITLYSTTRIALALMLARIPYRLAPASKIAQLFYTKRLTQRRSRSQKPEYLYNQDLAEVFLNQHLTEPPVFPQPPYLVFPENELRQLRVQFCADNNIKPDLKLVFLHPGSGGSANNLTVEQYASLAKQLCGSQAWRLVISAGPGEEIQARKLLSLCKTTLDPVLYLSQQGLESFSRLLAIADLFISGSTGPLHIAGALDTPTAAFYTRRRSATALRWQTLNAEARRLAFSPPPEAEAEDMQSIDIQYAAQLISRTYL